MPHRIHVSYFSDILCVWAYVAQVRLDELERRHGADIVELSAAEFRKLEPGIRMPVHRALSFHRTRVVRDPQQLVQAYVDRFVMDGGCFMQTGVTRVDPGHEAVTVSLDDGSRLICRKLVVAAA